MPNFLVQCQQAGKRNNATSIWKPNCIWRGKGNVGSADGGTLQSREEIGARKNISGVTEVWEIRTDIVNMLLHANPLVNIKELGIQCH